jgi:hypothetical protein
MLDADSFSKQMFVPPSEAVARPFFAVVAGLVVRHNKVWTIENLPLAVRAGLEAPGIMHSRDHEEPKQ